MADFAGEGERSGLARHASEIVLRIVDQGGPLPRDLITRKGLENACAAVAATGGSTNAILHLPAIAHEAGLSFAVYDLAPVARRALLLAARVPGEHELAGHPDRRAGVTAALKSLLAVGALHRDALTIGAVPLHAALSNVRCVGEDSCRALPS